jgi:hypothetical protein
MFQWNTFFISMGALVCSLFLFIRCGDKPAETNSLQELASSCNSIEKVELKKIDTSESFTLLLNDSTSVVNTNIPIKKIDNFGYLITMAHEILKFDLSQIVKNTKVKTELVATLPYPYTIGITDFFINENQLWIISGKSAKHIFSFDFSTGKVDTLLTEQNFLWNSFPFVGAKISKENSTTFCLPVLEVTDNSNLPLFSTFQLKGNKLVFENSYGVFNAGTMEGWSPFSMTPIFSNYENHGYWVTTSTGHGVIHYSLKDHKLQQNNSLCFPTNGEDEFIKNLPFGLQEDRQYVSKVSIMESYNLRLLCDEKHVLKFVKEKQPFLNQETQMKYIMNDSPWFIECVELETNQIKRLKFQNKTHYYTLAFLSNERLIVAKQRPALGSIEFNMIHL